MSKTRPVARINLPLAESGRYRTGSQSSPTGGSLPATVTCATENTVSGGSHTHKAAASAAPGAVASLLKTDENGYLQLERLGIGVAPACALHVLDAAEQLCLAYDAYHYAQFEVDASGDVTVTPSGGDMTVAGTLRAGVLDHALSDLSDVNTPSPTDGQVLTWAEAAGKWQPATPDPVITDHGALTGLGDDDHAQYLLADGSRGLSADWDAGAWQVRAETFQSDVATGTPPFTIASTTLVTSLNADQLDGLHASAFAAASHSHVEADISDLDHDAAKLQSRTLAATTPTDGQVLMWNDTAAQWEPSAASAGVTDHGALTGLGDDDHTQYLLADGSRTLGGVLTVASGIEFVNPTNYIEMNGGEVLIDTSQAANFINLDITANPDHTKTQGAAMLRAYNAAGEIAMVAVYADASDRYAYIQHNVGVAARFKHTGTWLYDAVTIEDSLTVTSGLNVGTATGATAGHIRASGAVEANALDIADTLIELRSDSGYAAFYGYSTIKIGTQTANSVVVETNDTERMRVSAAGDVGIGTDSPACKAHVVGPASPDGPILLLQSSISAGNYHGLGFEWSWGAKAGIYFERTATYGRGSLHIVNGDTAADGDATLTDARVTVLSGGDVGIGTTSPTTPLDVRGAGTSSPWINTLTLKDTRALAADVGGGIGFHGIYTSGGGQTAAAFIHAAKQNATDGQYGFDLVFGAREHGGAPAEMMRLRDWALCFGYNANTTDRAIKFFTGNGYEGQVVFMESTSQNYGMGVRYNASNNALYIDRYANSTSPTVLATFHRDSAKVEMTSELRITKGFGANISYTPGDGDIIAGRYLRADGDRVYFSDGTYLYMSSKELYSYDGTNSTQIT